MPDYTFTSQTGAEIVVYVRWREQDMGGDPRNGWPETTQWCEGIAVACGAKCVSLGTRTSGAVGLLNSFDANIPGDRTALVLYLMAQLGGDSP